jgi:DNA-binding MarR family transcriptional regulator
MAARPAVGSDLLAFDLAARVSALQRVLRRRTRAALGEPGLSPAEAEVLLLIAQRPGLRVGEAAVALRLAPNTVSTLVRRLVDQGLLVGERDVSDRRGLRLRASAVAERRVRRWRDERAHLLADALGQLSDSERHGLESSLPVLAVLVEALEEREPA